MNAIDNAAETDTKVVQGFDAVVDLLVMVLGHDAKISRYDHGVCCDRGPWRNDDVDSDTTDLLSTLLIYREPAEDTTIWVEFFANQHDQIDRDSEFRVGISSGFGEYSTSEWTVTPA